MLTAALVVGICLGTIAAERLYLASQERQHPGAVARSRKALQTGGEGTVLAAGRSHGKPRNELERLLQRVAPQGEVLIAISNSNLLHGELQMWIDVSTHKGRAAAEVQASLAHLLRWQPSMSSALWWLFQVVGAGI